MGEATSWAGGSFVGFQFSRAYASTYRSRDRASRLAGTESRQRSAGVGGGPRSRAGRRSSYSTTEHRATSPRQPTGSASVVERAWGCERDSAQVAGPRCDGHPNRGRARLQDVWGYVNRRRVLRPMRGFPEGIRARGCHWQRRSIRRLIRSSSRSCADSPKATGPPAAMTAGTSCSPSGRYAHGGCRPFRIVQHGLSR